MVPFSPQRILCARGRRCRTEPRRVWERSRQGCLGWQQCPELPWLQGKAQPELCHLLDLHSWPELQVVLLFSTSGRFWGFPRGLWGMCVCKLSVVRVKRWDLASLGVLLGQGSAGGSVCGKGTKMGSGELWGHVSDVLPALGVLSGVAAGAVPMALVLGVTLLSWAPSSFHLWRVPKLWQPLHRLLCRT